MNLAHKQKPLPESVGSGSEYTKENSSDPISVLDAAIHFASRIGICMTRLDPIGINRHHAGVAVNPVTGCRSPNDTKRISRTAVFAALVRLQWVALVGRASALPVSCRRSANPALRHPSRFAAGCGSYNATHEGTMYTIMPRALSRLFPIFAVPVTTLPTLAEARALAALLVSQGSRARIQSDAQGFAVLEVRV